MKTIPRNEELNAASERMNQRLNDEYIRQQVERYRQEQSQRQQRDSEASTEVPRQTTESAELGARS